MAAASRPPPSDQRERGETAQPSKGAQLRVHFAYPGARALLTHSAFQVQTSVLLELQWNGHPQQLLLPHVEGGSRHFLAVHLLQLSHGRVWTLRVTLLCDMLVLTEVRGGQMG